MAYGKGQNADALKRMADLGRFPLVADHGTLRLLRTRWLESAQRMADAIWPKDFLDPTPSGKDVDQAMLRLQAEDKGRLNSVWSEKARLAAKDAVLEQWKRAQRCLFGRFKHIASVGDVPMEDGARRLLNLPEEWSRRLTAADIESLQALADTMDFKSVLGLFLTVTTDGAHGLPQAHAEALKAMHAAIAQKYNVPRWNADEAVVQLHVDFRCVHGGRPALTGILDGLTSAMPAVLTGKAHRSAISLADVLPRGPGIQVPLALGPAQVQRLAQGPRPIQPPRLVKGGKTIPKQAGEQTQIAPCLLEGLRFAALAVEIGPNAVAVRGVLARPDTQRPLPSVKALLGRDFGYRTTTAWTVVTVDGELSTGHVERIQGFGKKDAKEFLSTHAHDRTNVVGQKALDGRGFLRRIAERAARVDRLRSEIDLLYNRIRRIRDALCRMLGLPVGSVVPEQLEHADGMQLKLHGKLFRCLGQVRRLKELRIAEYRAVDGLKKSWFGFASTEEVRLALAHGAAVVREKLTVEAIPVDEVGYKGRTFNRMLNNGSKGKYIRRASDKLAWFGVPEVVLPSYWTSVTDHEHGVVDKKQRNGVVFRSARTGVVQDADLHASETIAQYLLLRPLEVPGTVTNAFAPRAA